MLCFLQTTGGRTLRKIDNLVYKLYQLTYDEVKIIDPEFELTEQEYIAIKIG